MTTPDVVEFTLFFPELPDRNKWMRPALMTSNSIEYYTPTIVVNAVLKTLGKVDLDPCAEPERSFPAARHFTSVEDGLRQEWHGRVYMNPPYGLTIRRWTTKLRYELDHGWVTEAVALLPVRTDARWWQQLHPPYVCFIRGRLRFSNYRTSAPFASAAAYFGGEPERFADAFGQLGQVYAALSG